LKSFNARSPLVVIGHWQFVVNEQGLHAALYLFWPIPAQRVTSSVSMSNKSKQRPTV
jgi:hypothetical protein